MLSRHLWQEEGRAVNLYRDPAPVVAALGGGEEALALLAEALDALAEAAGLSERPGRLLSPIRHWLRETEEDGLEERFLVERAAARTEWEQLPCLPSSTQDRVRLLEELNPAGRWLALGDDDLLSLQCPRLEVLEADPALVDRLREAKVSVRWHDLQDPLPEPGGFSLVVTDPPYRALGMARFLTRAREALQPGGQLVLVTCPDLLEAPLDLAGFTLERHQPAFSRYPAPEGFRVELRRHLEAFDLPSELTEALCSLPYLYGDLYLASKC